MRSYISRFLVLFATFCLMTVPAFASTAYEVNLENLELQNRGEVIEDFPVAVGVVIPNGYLDNLEEVQLVDDLGQEINLRAEATGFWDAEHKFAKWVLLHFKASSNRRYRMKIIPGYSKIGSAGGISISENENSLKVNTGAVKVEILKSNLSTKLFDRVQIAGRDLIENTEESSTGQFLAIETKNDTGVGSSVESLSVKDWHIEVEENFPDRVVLLGTGYFKNSNSENIAKFSQRYYFYHNESFVRVQHTLTWLKDDCSVNAEENFECKTGIRRFSFRIRPVAGDTNFTELAHNDQTFETEVLGIPAENSTFAITQASSEEYHVMGLPLGESRYFNRVQEARYPGLVSIFNEHTGVAISAKHFWQKYPAAFSYSNGYLDYEMWSPRTGKVMYFGDRDFWDDENSSLYTSTEWQKYNWSKSRSHFVDESRKLKDKSQSRFYNLRYSAEGVAISHDVTFNFYDSNNQIRSNKTINSLTQHPLILRQDPKSAMRVDFLGYQISSYDNQDANLLESSVEKVAKGVLARSSDCLSYGKFRFGFLRWGTCSGGLYRLIDGLQYDLQLIPILLFQRGGNAELGRYYYEEMEATSRYAMDVHVNHYNTRGVPTGFMTSAGGSPFPWDLRLESHSRKGHKIHWLAYYYHLTGDKRAKEVMDEVISGTRESLIGRSEIRNINARELNNMNRTLVQIYEETFDPEFLNLIKKYRDITKSTEKYDLFTSAQFDPETKSFRGPEIYIFEGMTMLDKLLKNDPGQEVLQQEMMEYVDSLGITKNEILTTNGRKLQGAFWAYQHTKNVNIAKLSFESAKLIARTVKDLQFNQYGEPLPAAILGHEVFGDYIMPMLIGQSLANQADLEDDSYSKIDSFVSLDIDKGTASAKLISYVDPLNLNQPLAIRILSKPYYTDASTNIKVDVYCNYNNALLASLASLSLPPPASKPGFRYALNKISVDTIEFSNIQDLCPTGLLRVEINGRGRDSVIVDAKENKARVAYRLPREANGNNRTLGIVGTSTIGSKIYFNSINRKVLLTNQLNSNLSLKDEDSGEIVPLVGSTYLNLSTSSNLNALLSLVIKYSTGANIAKIKLTNTGELFSFQRDGVMISERENRTQSAILPSRGERTQVIENQNVVSKLPQLETSRKNNKVYFNFTSFGQANAADFKKIKITAESVGKKKKIKKVFLGDFKNKAFKVKLSKSRNWKISINFINKENQKITLPGADSFVLN